MIRIIVVLKNIACAALVALRAASRETEYLLRYLLFFGRNGILFNRYLASGGLKKLTLGSGPNPMKGWLNTDRTPKTSETAFLDVRKRFPFKDGAFDRIFCEHLIEHLDYRDGETMLRESFRVLRPRGKIRISTPDLAFLIRLHGPDKSDLEKRYIKWSIDSSLPAMKTYLESFVINHFFRSWGHRFIYDYATLQFAFESVGFTDVTRHSPGESADPDLAGIEVHGSLISDEWNRLESMVVEAVKPL